MTESAKKVIQFWKAQDKAEKEGKDEFICPLCGGKAWWVSKRVQWSYSLWL